MNSSKNIGCFGEIEDSPKKLLVSAEKVICFVIASLYWFLPLFTNQIGNNHRIHLFNQVKESVKKKPTLRI